MLFGKKIKAIFLRPSLDISQLTSVAVKSLLLSDPNVINTWLYGVL